MRSLFRILIGLSIVPAVLGILFIAIGLSGKIELVLLGLGFWLPLVGSVMLKRMAGSKYRRKFEQAISENGGSKYADYSDLSGIAISNDGRLVLSNMANTRSYSRADIRSYEWKTFEAGISGRKGFATLAQEQRQHDDGNGLFLFVKDVENPVWHIRFKRKPMMDKWFEILNQTLGESHA